jgi:putative multicomponent Na+:H+ antiporter subunit B
MNELFSLASELDLLLPITALLPLTAVLLVSQSNPYQTLVLRGILGSVSTLVYARHPALDDALRDRLALVDGAAARGPPHNGLSSRA